MRFKKFKFKKVKSTNNTAIRIIRSSNFRFGMVIADTQSNGKGQYGKKWISNKGNLFVSIFFSLEKINLSLEQLTNTNVKLIINLISKYYKKRINIKMPNDILINKKKICGILQESIEKNNIKYLIVGIGLNLIRNPKISSYPTTNLYDLTKKKICISKVIKDLKYIYKIFLKSQKVH